MSKDGDLCVMCYPTCQVCGERFTPYRCKTTRDMMHTKFCRKCNQETCEVEGTMRKRMII